MKNGVLIWLLVTVIYVAFSSDNDAWNAIYFMKESLTTLFLLLYIRNFSKANIKKFVNVALLVGSLRCLYGIAVMFKIITENSEYVTYGYLAIIGLILIIIGYDRKEK